MQPARAQPLALTDRRHTPGTGRVQTFLNSQRGLASFYAAEGKQIAASWSNLAAGDSLPQSPMLVPRAAATMEDESCATHEASLQQSSHPAPELSRNPKRVSHSQIASPRQIKHRNPGRSQLKPEDRDLILHDESERTKRLAQRRNSRRVRRAAMNGADEDTISDAASSQKDTRQPKKKRQKIASKSKSKKDKVAPALLLMQTFSGQGMSKSRMTMKPSKSVGVFNKGKASAKVQTKSRRPGGPKTDVAFSESAFLNQVRPPRSEHDTSTDDSDDSDGLDDSEVHSDHSAIERRNRRNTKSTLQPFHNGSLRERTPVDHDDPNRSALSSTGTVREASPPWDVEEQIDAACNSKVAPAQSPCISLLQPKTAVVGVSQCSWSSKLRNLGPYIVASQAVSVLSPPSKAPEKKRNTTSSYFCASQAPVEPSVALSPPLHGETNSITSITRDEATLFPLCSPLGCPGSSEGVLPRVALDLPDVSHAYMQVPQVPIPACHSPANSMDLLPYGESTEADFTVADGEHEEWQLQAPNHLEPVLFDEEAWDARRLLSLSADQRPPGWNTIGPECEVMLDESCRPYGSQEDRGYETFGWDNFVCESSYPRTEEGFDGEDIFEEDVYEGHYPEYENGMEYVSDEMFDDAGVDEQALGWTAVDGYDEFENEFDPLLGEPELEDITLPEEEDNATSGDRVEESTPSLVRIITAASLENDLLKSISSHWGAAHRLY